MPLTTSEHNGPGGKLPGPIFYTVFLFVGFLFFICRNLFVGTTPPSSTNIFVGGVMTINNILYTMTIISYCRSRRAVFPFGGSGNKEVKYANKLCRNNARTSESQQAVIPGDEPVYQSDVGIPLHGAIPRRRVSLGAL